MIYRVGVCIESDTTLNNKSNTFIRVNYHNGQVLQTNNFLKGENSNSEPFSKFNALNIEFGKQTDGKRLWEKLYNYPAFGIGLYTLQFLDGSDELGYPNALYGFLNAPFVRGKRWSFNYEVGFGLSYNWEPYDKDVNPLNIAIGSHKNVYVDAGINFTYHLSKRFVSDAGFSFTHFSNGASSVPNSGINLFAPKIGLRYQLRDVNFSFVPRVIPEFKSHNEFVVYLAVGPRNVKFDTTDGNQVTKYYDNNYLMANISVGYNRQISHKSKFGGGIDINYAGSTKAEYLIATKDTAEEIGLSESMSIALVGYYELVIGDLSVVIAPGYDIIRKELEGKSGKFYQKAGIRYYLLKDKNLFAGVSIRAIEFSIAQYVEWTIGHRLKWN